MTGFVYDFLRIHRSTDYAKMVAQGRLGWTTRRRGSIRGSGIAIVELTGVGPQWLVASVGVGGDGEDVGRVESTSCPVGESNERREVVVNV